MFTVPSRHREPGDNAQSQISNSLECVCGFTKETMLKLCNCIRVLYICVQAHTRNGVLTVALHDECSLSHYAMSAHCRSAAAWRLVERGKSGGGGARLEAGGGVKVEECQIRGHSCIGLELSPTLFLHRGTQPRGKALYDPSALSQGK